MKIQVRAAVAISVIALVAALGGVAGAIGGPLITGKQIKNGSLTTKDYRAGSVRTSDVQNGSVRAADLGTESVQSAELGIESVQSTDIGANQVTPADVEAPAPCVRLDAASASVEAGPEFVQVDALETCVKADPTSVLEVTWSGSASAGFLPCQFQVRVNGQPASAGAAVLYVANGSVDGNVNVTAAFFGLPAGPYNVSIHARSLGGATSTCTVGPDQAQISQQILAVERIV